MEYIILLIFSFFTEAVILWQYAASLFSPSHSGKKRLTLLSVLYVLLFFLSLLGQTWLNIISFFVINTVFLYIMFNLKLLLALFHSAILTAIMGISELAVLGMISRFFPHFLLEASVGLVFYTVFSKITFFAVVYLLSWLFKGNKAAQEPYGHSEILLMFIPLSSILMMFTLLSIGETTAYAPPVDFLEQSVPFFCCWSTYLYLESTNITQKDHRNMPICSYCSRKNPILLNTMK